MIKRLMVAPHAHHEVIRIFEPGIQVGECCSPGCSHRRFYLIGGPADPCRAQKDDKRDPVMVARIARLRELNKKEEEKENRAMNIDELHPETREKLGLTPVRTKGGSQKARHQFLQEHREEIMNDYRANPREAQERWKLSAVTRSHWGIRIPRGTLTHTAANTCPCVELLELRGYQRAMRDIFNTSKGV